MNKGPVSPRQMSAFGFVHRHCIAARPVAHGKPDAADIGLKVPG